MFITAILMVEVKFVKTNVRQEKPVVWAFTDASTLERDLRNYYYEAPALKTIKREPVSEELAKRTQGWGSSAYMSWVQENHRQAYNLGWVNDRE